MSRLAKNPVYIPQGVTVEVSGQEVKAKGPKGELKLVINNGVAVKLMDAEKGKAVKLDPKNEERQTQALWGTEWSLVRNMLRGVHEGYTMNLEIQGVGLRANLQGSTLVLQLGFSHDIQFPIPQGIKIEVDKQTKLKITGIDKQLVGQVAAKIRGFKPPEPYKGKGIRYEGQYVRRKEGKKK